MSHGSQRITRSFTCSADRVGCIQWIGRLWRWSRNLGTGNETIWFVCLPVLSLMVRTAIYDQFTAGALHQLVIIWIATCGAAVAFGLSIRRWRGHGETRRTVVMNEQGEWTDHISHNIFDFRWEIWMWIIIHTSEMESGISFSDRFSYFSIYFTVLCTVKLELACAVRTPPPMSSFPFQNFQHDSATRKISLIRSHRSFFSPTTTTNIYFIAITMTRFISIALSFFAYASSASAFAPQPLGHVQSSSLLKVSRDHLNFMPISPSLILDNYDVINAHNPSTSFFLLLLSLSQFEQNNAPKHKLFFNNESKLL